MKFGKRVVTFLSVICILLSALGSAVPVQALDAPVITPTDGSSHMLKRIEITGVDAPKAGEYFDTSAVVISDEDATWEIPVFWIGTHNAKSGDSRGDYTVSVSEPNGQTRKIRVSYIETQGVDAEKAEKDGYYIPILAFFLPDRYSCGGRVELDQYLSDLFEATGGVMTIENPSLGITYITGRIGDLTKFPVGTGAEQTGSEKTCGGVDSLSADSAGNEIPCRAADDADYMPVCTGSNDPAEEIGTENDDEPDEKTNDGSGNESTDVPGNDDPEDEPAEPEKTKYQLFADSYYDDPQNPDFGILFPNGVSDLDDIDWYAYLAAFGHKEINTLINPSAKYNIMMDNYLGIEELKSSDWYKGTVRDARYDAYYALTEDRRAAVPEELKAACEDRACLYIRQDDLEELLNDIVNVIQPHAVNLIKDNFPAFQAAGERELGRELGLRICYTSKDAAAKTFNRGSGSEYRYSVEYYADCFESGRDEDHAIVLELDSKESREALAITVLHENVHVFMNDFTRLGMKQDTAAERIIEQDDAGNYSVRYVLPGYEPMTMDEFSDYEMKYRAYPVWFIEGTAQLIAGFYQDGNSKVFFDRAGKKEDGRILYTKERIKAQYAEEIETLYTDQTIMDNDNRNYCYGPLAVMYLLGRNLESSGKPSALKYTDDGTLTDIDVAELRNSMSDIFQLLHSEKTLDEIIKDVLGEDCETFERMFIVGEEAGNTSLDFCTDVLNYLETASQKIGERASGSILQEFDKPYADLWIFDENETSDYYNYVITDNHYAISTADPEIAENTKPYREFDQEAYRREQAERENEALVGADEGNVPYEEAGDSGVDTAASGDSGVDAAAPEQESAEGDSRAAESKSAVGDSSSFETESVLSDAEASAWDDHFEEAGMSGHEESAGAEYSEEQTCAPESCGEDTATGYELSDAA